MTFATSSTTSPSPLPVMLLLDTADDHAIHRAAYQRAHPARGRITVDPTPHTSSLAYLALDLLRSMGRESFSRPNTERMSTAPAWRAVTCWTLATGLVEAVVLRAHHLTPERLNRLATWRTETGIRLVLVAHVPTPEGERRLRERLAAAGLTNLTAVHGTDAILHVMGPAATGRRYGPPPPDHAYQLPVLPRSGVAAFRADCWRHQNDLDFAHTDGQYRAGYAAARTWLAHRLPAPAHSAPLQTQATGPGKATPWQDLEGVRLFLARLTTLSPSSQHTLARVRGAQAGFLSQALLLDVPDDMAKRGGPGITTVPITPRVEDILDTQLPNPLRAAAVAALLFTGTDQSLLSMTQLMSVDDRISRLAIDRDSRIYVGVPPGPRHMYAIPPRARPLIFAALEFRRRSPHTAAHHGLFANCFGTVGRFDHLVRDADLHIPAVLHPHPTEDWHTAVRCWHLNTPAPATPTVLPSATGA